MYTWLWGGRMTTDDTEELIHLENMNRMTELTNIHTAGRNMRRGSISLDSESGLRKKARKRHQEARELREREGAARVQVQTYNLAKIEEILRESVFQGLVIKQVAQQGCRDFELNCQRLSQEMAEDTDFRILVDEVLADRLELDGMTPQERQLGLRGVDRSDLHRAVKMEGMLLASISEGMIMKYVAQSEDRHFDLRCQKLSEEVSDDANFHHRVDEAFTRILAGAGMQPQYHQSRPRRSTPN